MKNQKMMDTRSRILHSAADLFHRFGVSATSVDDVLAASDTGKGQFYYYFSSKEELVRLVLQHHESRVAEILPDRLQTLDEFGEWMGRFVNLLTESKCRHACPIVSVGLEMAENEVIRQDVEISLLKMKNALAVFFTRLRERGEIDGDPTALADLVLAMIQGGLVIGKIERNPEVLQRSIDGVMDYLYRLCR